jgi:hypothetical protein
VWRLRQAVRFHIAWVWLANTGPTRYAMRRPIAPKKRTITPDAAAFWKVMCPATPPVTKKTVNAACRRQLVSYMWWPTWCNLYSWSSSLCRPTNIGSRQKYLFANCNRQEQYYLMHVILRGVSPLRVYSLLGMGTCAGERASF